MYIPSEMQPFLQKKLQYIFVRYTELQVPLQESEMTHKHREKTLHSIFCILCLKCNDILEIGFIRRILPTS